MLLVSLLAEAGGDDGRGLSVLGPGLALLLGGVADGGDGESLEVEAEAAVVLVSEIGVREHPPVVSLVVGHQGVEGVAELERLRLELLSLLLVRVPALRDVVAAEDTVLLHTQKLLIVVFGLTLLDALRLTVVIEVILFEQQVSSVVLHWSPRH